jgi:hypothetical protein
MRFVLLALLVGCMPPPDPQPIDPPGWSNPGGTVSGCTQDAQCFGGNVCARTGGCVAPSDVRAVHVTWTLTGQPASAASCTNAPNLVIHFVEGNDGEWIDFSPVPCSEGKFTVDKLPSWFTRVTLKKESDTTKQASDIDTTGNATLDLPY